MIPPDGGWRAAAGHGPRGRSPRFHARYRAFPPRLPVGPGTPDPLHSLPGDRLRYLLALLRDSPQRPPELTPEEWLTFLELLRLHGVAPLLEHRLRSWPEDCRPPPGVADDLDAARPGAEAGAGGGRTRLRRRDGRGHAQRRSPVRRR